MVIWESRGLGPHKPALNRLWRQNKEVDRAAGFEDKGAGP